MRSKDININFLHMLFLNDKTNDTKCKKKTWFYHIKVVKTLTLAMYLFCFYF